MYTFARTLLLMALFASLAAVRPASAQAPAIPPFDRADTPGEPPPVPGAEGEVQGRGPINEGFAQPGGGVGRPAGVVPKEPPTPIPETPPAQRPAGDGVAWIPGYWSWDEERRDFLWVTGSWRVAPAGRTWVPGYWAEADDGWRWVSGQWAVSARARMQYLPEPPASLDRGPSVPPPEVDYSYVPGTWLYDETRWLWRPGYYAAPRDGLVYTPSRYVWTPRGFVFVPGFWDRPLDSRGTLFASVYFGSDFAPPVGWAYRPRFAVDLDAALGSLWVGPGASSYAFGDYYAPRYARAGYRSWLVYGPAARDPLYGYYQNANRNNPAWRSDLVATHNGRIRGTVAAPPPTLAAQSRVGVSLRTITPLARSGNPPLRSVTTPVAPRRVSASYSPPPQRTANEAYRLPPPRETVRSASTVGTPRTYAATVQRPTPAPIARPRPVQAVAPRPTTVQHYAPPAARYTPPAQHYAAPPTRHPPPARSAPPAHTSAGRGHHR